MAITFTLDVYAGKNYSRLAYKLVRDGNQARCDEQPVLPHVMDKRIEIIDGSVGKAATISLVHGIPKPIGQIYLSPDDCGSIYQYEGWSGFRINGDLLSRVLRTRGSHAERHKNQWIATLHANPNGKGTQIVTIRTDRDYHISRFVHYTSDGKLLADATILKWTRIEGGHWLPETVLWHYSMAHKTVEIHMQSAFFGHISNHEFMLPDDGRIPIFNMQTHRFIRKAPLYPAPEAAMTESLYVIRHLSPISSDQSLNKVQTINDNKAYGLAYCGLESVWLMCKL